MNKKAANFIANLFAVIALISIFAIPTFGIIGIWVWNLFYLKLTSSFIVLFLTCTIVINIFDK